MLPAVSKVLHDRNHRHPLPSEVRLNHYWCFAELESYRRLHLPFHRCYYLKTVVVAVAIVVMKKMTDREDHLGLPRNGQNHEIVVDWYWRLSIYVWLLQLMMRNLVHQFLRGRKELNLAQI